VGEQYCHLRLHQSAEVNVPQTGKPVPSVTPNSSVEHPRSPLFSPPQQLLSTSTMSEKIFLSKGGLQSPERGRFICGDYSRLEYLSIWSDGISRVIMLLGGKGLGGTCGLEDGDCLWDCCCGL